MAITNKSTNPYYLVDPVTYAEFADKIVVLSSLVESAQLIASGNGVVKLVAADINTDVTGNNNITLTNMTVRQDVYGGVIVSSSANPAKPKISKKYIDTVTAELTGDTSVTIQNGVYRDVYGGGAGFNSTVTGDSVVNYYGGNAKAIYGGGSDGAITEGDTFVNIIGSPASGRISKIYGGGKDATVVGNTTVTFGSDANLINFTGTVYGGGKGKKSIVGGTRTLVFDNYSGDFNASIKDFTNIQFVGSTTVTVNKKLDKSVSGAIYEFVLTDESLQNVNAMLTLTKKHDAINNVVVTIESQEMVESGGTVYLIESSFFRTASSFNASTVLVQNSSGQQISEVAYNIIYEFDKKEGGSVAIEYLGGNLILDGTETEKVILSDADDEVNIVGGTLMAGLDTDGGDDIVNVQSGSTVNGGINTGEGDDTLYIQKDTQVNGYINMDGGNDRLVVNESASLSSDVIMGDGENTIDVNRYATITGRIILEDGSTNTIYVKGGGISGIDSGDSTTTNTFIFDGFYNNSYVCSDYCDFDFYAESGGVGSWQEVFIPDYDYYDNGYYISVFVSDDLILGDSQDTVTFNSYATVSNIIMGGGDDVLTLKDDSFVDDSIYLGDGNDLLTVDRGATFNSYSSIDVGDGNDVVILNQAFSGQIFATEGENVIVAGTDMTLDAANLNLGSTGSVLVIENGATVEIDGMSYGNFLTVQNDAVYLDQNASVISHGRQYIQNYTGTLTVVDNNLIIAASVVAPTAVAPYIYLIDEDIEVDSSEIYGNGDLTVQEGATVLESELEFDGDADIDGTVDTSDLTAASATIGATGLVVDSTVDVTGDVDVDGTVETSDLIAGGAVNINGIVQDSTVSANAINVDGTVEDSALTATWINVNVAELTGSLTATTGDVDFSVDFFNDALSVDAPRIELTTDGILVTIGTTTATDFNIAEDAILYVAAPTDADEYAVLGNVATSIDTLALGLDNMDLIMTGGIDAGATVTFNTNEVTFISTEGSLFDGSAILEGDNKFIISTDSWLDWQQLTINGTLGFILGEDALFSIDGYVDVDPMSTIVDQTVFGQNSVLALGEWIYIQDWNATFDLTATTNLFPQSGTNLEWNNVHIVENAVIWGAVSLDDDANELVVSDGVVINGNTALYDYAAILALGGNDIITVGAAVINGTINGGEGDNELTLDGTEVNTAINQGVPAIQMGSGTDDIMITDSTINGDIETGAGADTLIIDPTTIIGDIDMGSENDYTEIVDSDVTGNIFGGEGDDTLVVESSTVVGDIDLGAGDDGTVLDDEGVQLVNRISASTIEGNVNTGAGADTLVVENASTIEGDIDAADDGDTISLLGGSSVNNIDLGDGGNDLTITASTVENDVLGGADSDDVALSDGAIVRGDVVLGDGANTAAVVNSEIVGALLGGSGNDEVTLTTAVIGGGIDLGSGGDNDILSGGATVTGDVVMGTQQVLDELDIPIVPWDTTANNDVIVDGGTLDIEGSLLMAGATNDVSATNAGVLDVSVDLNMRANDNQILIDGMGEVVVGGNINMTAVNNTVNEISVVSPDLETGDTEVIDTLSSSVTATAINMTSEDENIVEAYDIALEEDESLTVNNIFNTISATGGLTQDGVDNELKFNMAGSVDGEYDTNVHLQSILNIGTVDMLLEAPVVQTGAMWNDAQFNFSLDAIGEGDIVLSGPVSIVAVGGITMESSNSNELEALVDLHAGNQAVVDLNNQTVEISIGGIDMTSNDAGFNGIELGVKETVDGAVTGEIRNADNASVTVDGSISMVGIGSTNNLDIFNDVTITGPIVMGDVIGDDVSLVNNLNVFDPGSIESNQVTLIAQTNNVVLDGSGTINDMIDIYGGSNSLDVGADVIVNDVVSFGSIYDTDMIGIEDYLIVKNTDNTVNIYGKVGGIDTTVDLGGPLGTVNDSADTIYVSGTVNEIADKAPLAIITGNGDDSLTIEGGLVDGDVKMGDFSTGGAGTNIIDIDSTATESGVIDGNVVMESDSFNQVSIDGAVVTSALDRDTEVRASISGSLSMKAEGSGVGTNDLNIGIAASILGAVTMTADGMTTNDVDVNADWLKEYVSGPNPGQFNGTSDVLSLTMECETNTVDVNTGTFIITEADGVIGLSMTQGDMSDGGTNTLTITDQSAMVMSPDALTAGAGRSNILMGNLDDTPDVDDNYTYYQVLMEGDLEDYYFLSSTIPGTTFYDTDVNTISIGGKLRTGDTLMIGIDNNIDVLGPADTSVPGAYLPGDDPLLFERALFEAEAVTQMGETNSISADTANPGDTAEAGLAAVVTGDILQYGIESATDILGTDLDVATENSVNIATNAWLDSGAITQQASESNSIEVSGFETPAPLGGYQATITQSLIDGPIAQTATDGSNLADLYTTNVNGAITQIALTTNELYVDGEVLPANFDATTLYAATLPVVSTVNGAISQDASSGDNTIELYVANVNGGIDQDTYYGNNSLISDGVVLPVITGVISGDDVLLQAAAPVESVIGGAIDQYTVAGSNYINLQLTDVSAGISQNALGDNTLLAIGQLIDTGFVAVIGDNADGSQSVLQGKEQVVADIGGNVQMDSVYGDNTANLKSASVNGTFTQNAYDGYNDLELGGIISGAVTQYAYEYNYISATGTWAYAAVGPDAGAVNEVVLDDILDPTIVLESSVASISQESVDSANSTSLTLTDVVGDITQLAPTNSNNLGITGTYVPALYAGAGYANEDELLIDRQAVYSNVGGSVTQDGGNNNASMTMVQIDGSVEQDGVGYNGLGISGLIASEGPILQPGGPGTEQFLEVQAEVFQSSVGGEVIQTSSNFSNYADLNYVTTGNVTQTASQTNTLEVTGYVIPEILGIDAGGIVDGKVLQAETTVLSEIGNVIQESQIADDGAYGVLNNASFDLTDVGDVTQSNVWEGVNQGQIINDIVFQDSLGGNVSQTTINGTNDLDILDSTVGTVDMNSTNGSNSLYIDPSIVSDIVMNAGIDNTLEALGEYTPAGTPTQPGGPGTEEFLDDPAVVVPSELGTVDMTAGDTNSLTMTNTNSDAVTMDAEYVNWATITGTAIPEILGDDGLGDPTGKVLQAASNVESVITGNLSMVTQYTGSDTGTGWNYLSMDIGGVTGDIDMVSNYGTADPGTADPAEYVNYAIINDSTIGGSIDQSAVIGTNFLYIDPSTVGGNISQSTGAGDNTLEIYDTAVIGSITQTTVEGINSLTMADGSVGGGIVMVGGGISGDSPNVISLDSVNVSNGINTGTGISNITVTGTSIVTGGISTDGGSDSVSVKGTAVVDTVDTGAGNDRVNLNDSAVISGDIDVGTGSDIVSVTQAAFDVSKVVFGEEVEIRGGSTSFTVSDDTLGVADQTLTIDDTGVSTLTLGQLGTAGSSTDGVLGTVSTSGLDAVILDASGLGDGDTLVNATGATDWDTMNDGDTVQILVDQLTDGDSIVLVDGYEVGGASNLDAWVNNGVNSISLTIDGVGTVSLDAVVLGGSNDDYYQYTSGSDQWNLEFVDGDDKLTLTYTVIP